MNYQIYKNIKYKLPNLKMKLNHTRNKIKIYKKLLTIYKSRLINLVLKNNKLNRLKKQYQNN